MSNQAKPMNVSLDAPVFGTRLRDERDRLRLTQEQFAPRVDYLVKLQHGGVDAYYVLTGKRLIAPQVDVQYMRSAFLFVLKNFALKPGATYSEDQLFEKFKDVLRLTEIVP